MGLLAQKHPVSTVETKKPPSLFFWFLVPTVVLGSFAFMLASGVSVYGMARSYHG